MDMSKLLWRSIQPVRNKREISTFPRRSQWICTRCLRGKLQRSNPLRQHRRHQSNNAADSPTFRSVVDNPPILVRSGRRHKPLGLLVLAAIPVTAFFLGCWQVQRLGWKTQLIAKFEDRLIRDPLPLPPVIDPDAVKDFDYRRVVARGTWQHDKEMLIGPRLHDGEDGYLVVTPLDRTAEFPGSSTSGKDDTNTSILVCRGWIRKDKAAHAARPDSLPTGPVRVEGLLREPWKRNSFTPANRPERAQWYFPDVHEMAAHAGTQPVWIEETMRPDLLVTYDRSARGVPIGRSAEVNLRNNHAQYIFTWFSLSAATSLMLWMVVRRAPSRRGVRQNTSW